MSVEDTGATSELRDQIAETVTDWALMYPLSNWGFWGQASGEDAERLRAIATKLARSWGDDIADKVTAKVQPLIDRAERAEAAIERAQVALTNALGEWQPEYEYRLERAKRKGYSHDEIAVGTIGDAIKVASGVLAALGQPPAEKEEDPNGP